MKKAKSKARSSTPAKRGRRSSNAPSVSAFGEKWPLERDILWRPERFKYVRKLVKDDGCVFCAASTKKPSLSSLVLGHGEHSSVVLNKYPYNTGHLLIVPKRHCGDLNDLSRPEYFEIQELVRASLRFLKESYECHGFNVGLNLGAAAGAGIPDHLHYHIIPRWAGDSNFFPLIAETKVLPETLEQTFERLIPYFKDMSFLRS